MLKPYKCNFRKSVLLRICVFILCPHTHTHSHTRTRTHTGAVVKSVMTGRYQETVKEQEVWTLSFSLILNATGFGPITCSSTKQYVNKTQGKHVKFIYWTHVSFVFSLFSEPSCFGSEGGEQNQTEELAE